MNTPRATIKVAQRRIFLPETWSLLTLGRGGDRDIFVNPGPSIQTVIKHIDLSQYMSPPDKIPIVKELIFSNLGNTSSSKGTIGNTEHCSMCLKFM
jgi:hypothetical protein